MFRKQNKNVNTRIEVREILRGCEAGRLQSVGYMQVIPLVSDLDDDQFVSPVHCDAAVYTTSYGTLGFRNTSDSVMIVPCHAEYVVKQRAQDHAMAHAGVVAASCDRHYDTAACIQASQGGFIQKGPYRMLLLPHALQKRGDKNYQKLSDDISVFNQRFGVNGQEPNHSHCKRSHRATRRSSRRSCPPIETDSPDRSDRSNCKPKGPTTTTASRKA